MTRQKKQTPPRSSPPARFWSVAGVLLVIYTLAAMLHVQTRLSLVELGYRLSQELSRQRQLQSQWRRMSIEAATLRHPRRVRSIATAQLGMVEPSAAQMISGAPLPWPVAAARGKDR